MSPEQVRGEAIAIRVLGNLYIVEGLEWRVPATAPLDVTANLGAQQ